MSFLFSAIAFVCALVVLSTLFEYWQSRLRGQPHEVAMHDTVVAGTFLSGSAVFGYIATFII